MPRTCLVCLTIVAAFSSPLFAAGSPTVLAPVPRPVLDVARTLDLPADPDRIRFLPDIVRLLHAGGDERSALLDTLRAAEAGRAAPPVSAAEAARPRVLVPLDPSVWSTAVFKRPVPLGSLLMAIVTDRRAAWLAAGLAAMDDDTLTYLSDAPALVTELHERGAAAIAAFGASLHVRDGRVITPGLDADRVVWETVVGAPVTAPDRFIKQVFAPLHGGRLAYVYASVALLDAAHTRFALGPLEDDVAVRVERLRALVALASTQYSEWRDDRYPYMRPLGDLSLLLHRAQVDDAGHLRPPAERAFWQAVWHLSAGPGETAGPAGAADAGGPADAAWLAAAAAHGNMYDRGDRLDQLAFAQRVFGAAAGGASSDASTAVAALPRQKMLMLTLERMGFRSAALYAFVAQHAARLEIGDSNRGFWVMAQLQPALALVARMTIRGAIDARTSESLVRSLFSVPLDGRGQYLGGIARWVIDELTPVLPPSTDVDTSLLLALAGPPVGARAPVVEWEGERYRVDVPAAERRRLRAVREKQGGPTVALATAVEGVAVRLSDSALDADRAAAAHSALLELQVQHADALASSATDMVPAGITAPRRARDVLDRIVVELGQAARAHDARRAARQAAALHELADVALAHALLSTAYAVDLGDPEGAALLSRNAAFRHDFGFGRLDSEARARVVWAVPRQDFQPGVAWHVVGSALGLDIALARLALTRINADRLSKPPRVVSLDREAFAVGLALLDARVLRDDTMRAIATAVDRGITRVRAAGRARDVLLAMADELGLDQLRRRRVLWAVEESSVSAADQFTLTELVLLGGGPKGAELDRWGANALPTTGCPCTARVAPSAWPLLIGRPQVPMGAAAVPDLNIRIASVLAELGLPAALMRPVLAAAIQDFLEDAVPVDGGDWWALSAAARAVPRQRVEDYVAAAASVGGALIPDGDKEP